MAFSLHGECADNPEAAPVAAPAPAPAAGFNPNVLLALVNGTAAGVSAAAVAYSESKQVLPSLGIGALQFGIFGGWQLNLDRAVKWMGTPFRWDKTKSRFPTGVTKLGMVNLVCIAAAGCFTHFTGLSHETLLATAGAVALNTVQSTAVGTPVYESVKLYAVDKPSRLRRFLLNFAPFTMEVTLNMAQVAGLVGMKTASNIAYGAILTAGVATWAPTVVARKYGAAIKGFCARAIGRI